MLLRFATAKGSHGATTIGFGLCLAWARLDAHALFVEADASGGSLGARLSIPPQPGLLSLATDGRHGVSKELLLANARSITERAGIVIAPSDPRQCAAALEALCKHLSPTLEELGSEDNTLVVADLGRLGAVSVPELAPSSPLLWVTSPTLEGADGVSVRTAALGVRERSALLVSGDGPYSPAQVASALHLPLAGVLPADPSGAEQLWSNSIPERAWKKGLLRGLASLCSSLRERSLPEDHSMDLPEEAVAEAVSG